MATSFLSRWSKRKLEESSQYDEELMVCEVKTRFEEGELVYD